MKVHTHIANAFMPLRNAIEQLDETFGNADKVLHAKRNTIKLLTISDLQIVAKKFRSPNHLQGWIYKNFRHSKARRSFEHAQHLATLGINTPAPIAYVEHYNNYRLGSSYYLCAYCEHNFSMQEVMQNPDHEKFKIIEAFTRFTYAMHEAGVLHLDHNAGNTLVTRSNEGYSFSVIDINRMQFRLPPKTLTLTQRLNNFVRLTDNKEVMRRFATIYAQCVRTNPETCITLLEKLKNKHHKKLLRKQCLKKLINGQAPK